MEKKKASDRPAPPREPAVPGYVRAPVRDLVAALQRAARQGKTEEALSAFRRIGRDKPDLSVLLPVDLVRELVPTFLALAFCTGRLGAWGPPTLTITMLRDTTAGAPTPPTPGTGRVTVTFSYTTGATPGCVVNLNHVFVSIAGSPLYECTATPGTGTAMTYQGTTEVPLRFLIRGVTGTVFIDFNWDNDAFCDTCMPPAVTTASATAALT